MALDLYESLTQDKYAKEKPELHSNFPELHTRSDEVTEKTLKLDTGKRVAYSDGGQR